MSAEFEIIERYFQAHAAVGDDILLGIGDDAALTRLQPGFDLVTATDALVEGTHFLPEAPARSVGHRCLAVNLSDLAAMGAEPLWASLALAVVDADFKWIQEFSEGFFALAEEHGVRLIGGDTVRGARSATVTLQGQLPQGSGVRRSGASGSDLVYLTGHPGDAAAGRLLASDDINSHDKSRIYIDNLINSFYYPEPRVAAGRQLSDLATAMIDVSDGLAVDLSRLLAASGVGASLDVASIPLSAALKSVVSGEQALELALCGGEDYELCFTIPANRQAELERRSNDWGCSIAQIGEVVPGSGANWLLHGSPFIVPASGFEHF